jgi:fumarate hydratase subunit alpha
MACVFLTLGQDVHLTDGALDQAVDEGVRRGYINGYLRKSIVADPLRRANTLDNTPALLHVDVVPGDACAVTVLPKGFGSENMSRVAMLNPADGKDGVMRFVIETVVSAGSNPCPPVIVGVGVGSSFDGVTFLAKKALLRELGSVHRDAYYAAMEAELLEAINQSGVGPQGYGGLTTALCVFINAAPTHIASLPVAVNLSCHATRRLSMEL